MARVSILKSPDELTGEARRIAERIVDTRKSLEGPFSVWMHAPQWAERVCPSGYVDTLGGYAGATTSHACSKHWSSAVTSRPNICGASRV